jgi:uroporphyrinogen-III decarboxylase
LFLIYSLPLKVQRRKGATAVLIVVYGPNRETSERFREFALSVIVGMQTGVRGRTGEATMYETCKNTRHQPIAWEIAGVEVRCPLCKALDEVTEIKKHFKSIASLSAQLTQVFDELEEFQ